MDEEDEMDPEVQRRELELIHNQNLALTRALPLSHKSLHLYVKTRVNDVSPSIECVLGSCQLRDRHRCSVYLCDQQRGRGCVSEASDGREAAGGGEGRGLLHHGRSAERVRRVHRGSVLRDELAGWRRWCVVACSAALWKGTRRLSARSGLPEGVQGGDRRESRRADAGDRWTEGGDEAVRETGGHCEHC